MATKPATDEAVVQLATRIPRELLQRIRIFCVQREQTMQGFVSDALREKLGRGRRREQARTSQRGVGRDGMFACVDYDEAERIARRTRRRR